ncbi:MAG: cytochrome P450 [Chloroflexi bacterium]|nr:cytochrome P450 [Chloroflexota bacterium]
MRNGCPHRDTQATAQQQSVETRLELPPGPRGRKLRNFRQRTTGYREFMDQLHEQYGDIVYYELPFQKCCAVFSAELIRDVLVTQESSFPPWFPGELHEFLEAPGCEYRALALSYGQEHKLRSALMKGAFTADRVNLYAESILAKACEFRERHRAGQVVDLIKEMERYVWDALVAIILGRDVVLPRSVGEDFLNFMKAYIILDMIPLGERLKKGQRLRKVPLPVFRRGYEGNETVDNAIYSAIERARDPSHAGDDVVSHYVRARERKNDGDWVLESDQAIRAEIAILLNAFVDAPTCLMVFGVHLLARRPSVLDRLQREVDEVLGGRPPRPEDFDRLRYARAVVSEILRLEPPPQVLLPKEPTRDCVVGGYLIPKGTLMHVAMRVLHHRPEHWDDPEDFRPERWLDEPPPGPPRVPEHAYIPFGLGSHICRGADVATRLFVLGMATFMQRLRFEPQSTRPPKRNDNAIGLKGTWFATVRNREQGSTAGGAPPGSSAGRDQP